MRLPCVLLYSTTLFAPILLCAGARATQRDDKVPVVMRVAPVKFNERDTKEVELPPGGEGGCVALNFDGTPRVHVHYERWLDGERLSEGQSSMRLDGPGRLAFSFGQIKDEDGKFLFQVITAESGILLKGKTTWRTPVGSATTRVIKAARITKAVNLNESESLVLWAILGYENAELAKGKALTLEEGPKHAKWAIVIKLSWTKQ